MKTSMIEIKDKEQRKALNLWAKQRDLIHEKNVPYQMMKVTEEIGELAAAVSRKNRDETIDAIGDSLAIMLLKT